MPKPIEKQKVTLTMIRNPASFAQLQLSAYACLFSFLCFYNSDGNGSLFLAKAQESSIPNLNVLDDQLDFRTPVCDRLQLVLQNEVSIPLALKGLNLSLATIAETPATANERFRLTSEGTIDPKLGGYIVDVMDEIAARGQFEWRNTFAAFSRRSRPANATWDDVLRWQVEKFDISAFNWARTTRRLSQLITFPEGWNDRSTIIVQKKEESSNKKKELNFLSFLRPFTNELWVFILAAITFSGMTFWFLERIDHKAVAEANGDELQNHAMGSIFLSLMAFVGQSEISPRSGAARASKLFHANLYFAAKAFRSSYTMYFSDVQFAFLERDNAICLYRYEGREYCTCVPASCMSMVYSPYCLFAANLASFLVSSQQEPTNIGTFTAAIEQKKSACTIDSTATHLWLQTNYPKLRLVAHKNRDDEYLALQNGDCDILVSGLEDFDVYSKQKKYNEECNLFHDGRTQAYGTCVETMFIFVSVNPYQLTLFLEI